MKEIILHRGILSRSVIMDRNDNTPHSQLFRMVMYDIIASKYRIPHIEGFDCAINLDSFEGRREFTQILCGNQNILTYPDRSPVHSIIQYLALISGVALVDKVSMQARYLLAHGALRRSYMEEDEIFDD